MISGIGELERVSGGVCVCVCDIIWFRIMLEYYRYPAYYITDVGLFTIIQENLN